MQPASKESLCFLRCRSRERWDIPVSYTHLFIQYANVPRTIAAVISGKMATLHELDTVYSVQDMWWLIEIMTVDNTNRAIAESDHGSNGN